MGKQLENLKAALSDIGIKTEADLEEAIKNLPPLKLGIFTGDIKERTVNKCKESGAA